MYNILNMLTKVIIFFLFINTYVFGKRISLLPKCSNCKSFVPSNLGLDYGKCKIFGEIIKCNEKNMKTIYNYAKHCRDNETQCGKNGCLHENDNIKTMPVENDITEIINAVEIKSKEERIEDLKDVDSQLYDYSNFLSKS
jgi:hypothetical protein